ncbi:hypothetical protein Bca4012_047130 [Brassica carinata]
MGNIFCCCTRGWGSNVPQATETTTDQPRSHSQNVTNQSVSTGSRSYYSAHSSPRTESYRGGASRHKTAKKIRQRQRLHSSYSQAA